MTQRDAFGKFCTDRKKKSRIVLLAFFVFILQLTLIKDKIICKDGRGTLLSGLSLHRNGGGNCCGVCNRECDGGLGGED